MIVKVEKSNKLELYNKFTSTTSFKIYTGEMNYPLYEDSYNKVYDDCYLIDTNYDNDKEIQFIVESDEYKHFLKKYQIENREEKLKRILNVTPKS